jgi:hypothetical protein
MIKNNMWFGFSIPHVMIIMIFLDTEAVIMEATSALLMVIS